MSAAKVQGFRKGGLVDHRPVRFINHNYDVGGLRSTLLRCLQFQRLAGSI